MKKKLWKKTLLIMPVIILFTSLLFIKHTLEFFHDMACTFVYDTNVGSVIRFSKEMQELTSAGYKGEEYDGLYNQMVFIYNKTLGEKVSILTFMLDENNTIHHSNTYNEQMLSPLLKNKDNMNMIYKETESNEFGEVTLNNENEQEIMYFHKIIISNGKQFFLFMGVDRERIISNLNANEIIIPICIVCMLLLGLAEYAVWMNIIYKPVHFQRNKS